MTPPVIERWEHIVRTRDATLIDGLLADEVIFESPVVHTPQAGRALTTAYLTAAVQVLGDAGFRFLNRWIGDRSAVLEFEACLDGVVVNGVDIISWNADDRIVHFKVMVRPLKGVNAIHQAMGKVLAQKS